MTQHAAPSTSAPATTSRRARRDHERALAAQGSARGSLRRAGVLALRRATAHPNLSAGLLGALAVVLPAAGLTLTDSAPAYAAVPDESVVDVLDRADAQSDVYAGSLTIDAAQLDAAEIDPAQLDAAEIDPAQCVPAQGADGAVALTAAPAAPMASAVTMPMAEGSFEITSPFGSRVHPISGDVRQHDGSDFTAPAGTPISAIAAGTVLHSGANIGRPGTLVVIEHEAGGQVWTSWYLHMYDQDIAVSEGQQVEAGQLVGLVGSAGNSTGPHLHLEIHEGPGTGGPAVDPMPWLAQHAAAC